MRAVTVYAFSIENFKRSADEVRYLLDLAADKFHRLVQETAVIRKYNVTVNVLGDLTLLPVPLRGAMAKAMLLSRREGGQRSADAHRSAAVLNICFAYTAREEMASAMRDIQRGVLDGALLPEDVSEELLDRCLYTGLMVDGEPRRSSWGGGDPDLLVRTSGESRLSDFLLWQSSLASLSFPPCLWPELSLWGFLRIVLEYQRNGGAARGDRYRSRAVQWERRREAVDARAADAHAVDDEDALDEDKDVSSSSSSSLTGDNLTETRRERGASAASSSGTSDGDAGERRKGGEEDEARRARVEKFLAAREAAFVETLHGYMREAGEVF